MRTAMARRNDNSKGDKNTVGEEGGNNLGILFGRMKKVKLVGMRSGRRVLILCWQG